MFDVDLHEKNHKKRSKVNKSVVIASNDYQRKTNNEFHSNSRNNLSTLKKVAQTAVNSPAVSNNKADRVPKTSIPSAMSLYRQTNELVLNPSILIDKEKLKALG